MENKYATLLRKLTFRILWVLVLQYILGMGVNLFVKIPDTHPGTNASGYFSGVVQGIDWSIFSGLILLAAHVVVGLGLVFFSIVLVIIAIRSREKIWIVSTLVAALFVLIAMFNGASFINYNHDFSSMIMATAFIIAFVAYSIVLYRTKPQTR
jgi:hypothetical protein